MEELAAPERPNFAQAINHIGPILIAFGTEAQKARHLPDMLSGDAGRARAIPNRMPAPILRGCGLPRFATATN